MRDAAGRTAPARGADRDRCGIFGGSAKSPGSLQVPCKHIGWHIKATGDFNGDSKSDILWQGQDGTPAIWTMDGTHVLSVGVAGSFNPGADWHVI